MIRSTLLLILLFLAGCAYEGRSPDGNPIIELSGDWQQGELICHRGCWWRIKKVSANVNQHAFGGGKFGTPNYSYSRYVELVPEKE